MKTKETIKTADHKGDRKMKKDNCRCNGDCPNCEKIGKQPAQEKSRVLVVSSILMLLTTGAFAQDAAAPAPSFWDDPFNSPMLQTYIAMAFIAITILLLIFVIFYLMRVMNIMVEQVEAERAARLGLTVKKRVTWWQKIWDQLNDAVPVAQEKDIELDHNYDGIRELDNHLPPWWTGLFYFTIIWGVIYLIGYHITGSFALSGEEYQAEVTRAEEQARAYLASRPAAKIDENALVYSADPAILAKGKTVFTSNNCASCHKPDGGGNNIGPNLTDQYWIHGGSIKDVFTTINKGVVDKGMPAWGKVMSPEDVRDVAFYVMSLQGTNPPDAKAPQGQLYAPEQQQPAAADTTQVQAINN